MFLRAVIEIAIQMGPHLQLRSFNSAIATVQSILNWESFCYNYCAWLILFLSWESLDTFCGFLMQKENSWRFKQEHNLHRTVSVDAALICIPLLTALDDNLIQGWSYIFSCKMASYNYDITDRMNSFKLTLLVHHHENYYDAKNNILLTDISFRVNIWKDSITFWSIKLIPF